MPMAVAGIGGRGSRLGSRGVFPGSFLGSGATTTGSHSEGRYSMEMGADRSSQRRRRSESAVRTGRRAIAVDMPDGTRGGRRASRKRNRGWVGLLLGGGAQQCDGAAGRAAGSVMVGYRDGKEERVECHMAYY